MAVSAMFSQRLRLISTEDHEAIAMALSSASSLIVTGGRDDTIRFWNANNTQNQGVLRGHLDDVTSLTMDIIGEYLLSGSKDGTLILWNMNSQELIKSIESAHFGEVVSLSIHPEGLFAVSGGNEGKVKLWSFRISEFSPP